MRQTKKYGFYDKNPGREMPIMQMMGKAPTENSKGVRLVNLPQVRDIQNEEIEAMLAGKQDAKTGARQRGDARSNAAIKEAANGIPVSARYRGATSPRACRKGCAGDTRSSWHGPQILPSEDCPSPRTS